MQAKSALILAGGEGKRMKSRKPKVLCEVLFQPMLGWVIDAVRKSGIDDICVVTGSRHEQVESYLSSLPFEVQTAFQSERLGTGHAVMMARDFLKAHRGGDVVILGGDAPFIDAGTISDAYNAQLSAGDSRGCTVISAEVENPFGYGRIIRKNGGAELECIVEEKEATPQQKAVREVNSGAYWFSTDELCEALGKLTKSEKTGEYYLTDTIEIIRTSGKAVNAFKADNADSVLGANDCIQLSQLNEIARMRVLHEHMTNGVSVPCTDGVIIGRDVRIGADTIILPSSVIRGGAVIGEGCEIGPGALVDGAVVPDGKKLR